MSKEGRKVNKEVDLYNIITDRRREEGNQSQLSKTRFRFTNLQMVSMQSIFVFLTTVGTFHNLRAIVFKKTRCVHGSFSSIVTEIV